MSDVRDDYLREPFDLHVRPVRGDDGKWCAFEDSMPDDCYGWGDTPAAAVRSWADRHEQYCEARCVHGWALAPIAVARHPADAAADRVRAGCDRS